MWKNWSLRFLKISFIHIGQIVQYHVWQTGPHVWQTNRLNVSRTDWSSNRWTVLSNVWRTDLRRADMCNGQIYQIHMWWTDRSYVYRTNNSLLWRIYWFHVWRTNGSHVWKTGWSISHLDESRTDRLSVTVAIALTDRFLFRRLFIFIDEIDFHLEEIDFHLEEIDL